MSIKFRDFENIRPVRKGKLRFAFQALVGGLGLDESESLDLTVARASEWVSNNDVSVISIETIIENSNGSSVGSSINLRHDQTVRIWYRTS